MVMMLKEINGHFRTASIADDRRFTTASYQIIKMVMVLGDSYAYGDRTTGL